MFRTPQQNVWRIAWLLLIAFAVTEAVATFLFWTYLLEPKAAGFSFNHQTIAVLLGCASLWSYVVFGFILIGLRRAIGS